jgi:ribosomal protein S18 acetylase RimI-like enzyme
LFRGTNPSRTPAVSVAELSPAGFTTRLDELLAVYAAAMRPPPELLAGRRAIMAGHAANPGFRALAVTDDATGRAAGFGYGFHGAGGQWWHDTVNRALTASRGGAVAAAWLGDSFEVAELHVAPDYQGHGVGAGLLLRLTSGRPERTALLSTRDADTPARRLYRGTGFTDLLTAFRFFPGGDPPYAVMGAELPLRSADPGGRPPGTPRAWGGRPPHSPPRPSR